MNSFSLIVFLIEMVFALNGYKKVMKKSSLIVRRASQLSINDAKFAVAPMMEYTDKHQRNFHRLLSKETVLYTEMVTANALIRTEDTERFIGANLDVEEPVVLQLGGSDTVQLKQAASIAYKYGYKEINLNVGCPSEKVAGKGCFGAALMLEPDLVGELALSISEVTNTPTTIKCRIGVNENDSYEELCKFIETVSEKGKVLHFIIHARKAILDPKFSPHDNRTIPPLKYDFVYRLVKDFPHLSFTLNGGINTIQEVNEKLKEGSIIGVMVGRAAVNYPYHWRNIDSLVYGKADPGFSRREIIEKYCKYADIEEKIRGPKSRRALVKPLLNLFHGEHNGKVFRKSIDEDLRKPEMSASEVLFSAIGHLDDSILDDNSAISFEKFDVKDLSK